jgi:16S rRNA (adenine1518-N6/adenine1519-N6)-dimethyltransferase
MAPTMDLPSGQSLPSLREVIERYGLRADRRLGQHFLLETNLLGKIARSAGELAGRTVLEVGPGPGGLTRALLAAGCARLVAIERDPRCVLALRDLEQVAGGRLRLIEGDALETDLDAALPGRFLIVANLPYNIATPLLVRWLGHVMRIDGMILMFQREVALRLVASPGQKAYGRLSVLVQWLCTAEIAFHLPARAFVPPPQVASSVVRLWPRAEPLAPAERADLEQVVAAAFAQRRKMLRQSLKVLGHPVKPLLEQAGLAPTARAEEIPVEGFCRLARTLRALTSGDAGADARGDADQLRN